MRVTLALPRGGAGEVVPVIVLLDGDFMFLTAAEFVRTLNLVTMGEFPKVAVVGVMRDESDPLRYASSRFRDFTPGEWVLPGPFAADNAMAHMGTGGAETFVNAILHDVLPGVRDRMTTSGFDVGEMAIGGWSLSGLCACWAWMNHADTFAHLLTISPSLWWHDASILDDPIGSRPAGQRVSVCVGEHEEGDVSLVYPRRFADAAQREMAAMVRNAGTFAERASQAGALVDHMVMPDEHHVTVQSAAIARGLRFIFS